VLTLPKESEMPESPPGASQSWEPEQVMSAAPAAAPAADAAPAATPAAGASEAALSAAEVVVAPTSRKRGTTVDQSVEQSGTGADGAPKRPRAAAADETDLSGAQHLGSVRVWIMDTHPRHCSIATTNFCYARCSPIKALRDQPKAAVIHAVRTPDDECGIAVHINGERAASFDPEQEMAFLAAIDAGQVILDRGVAVSWGEIDFDVRAGPANQGATVPREVLACDGFERGVLARQRMCDGNDCPCC
jgi:hypothetical protein